MKLAVECELKKGYSAADVHKHFMSRGKDGAYDAVEAAGGKYLDRARVQSWKQALGRRSTVHLDSQRHKAAETAAVLNGLFMDMDPRKKYLLLANTLLRPQSLELLLNSSRTDLF